MKIWLLALLALTSAELAQAQSKAAAPATPSSRQAAFAALKYRLLSTEAERQPAESGARIYLASEAAELELRKVRITVDGGTPVEQALSAAEAKVLTGGEALLRIDAASLPAGPHRLRAAVEVADREQPDAATQNYEVEAELALGSPNAAVELRLTAGSLFAAPQLELHQHSTEDTAGGWFALSTSWFGWLAGPEEGFVPGSVTDPRLRHASTLDRLGRHEDAVVELLALQKSSAALPETYWLALAASLRQAKLPDEANVICDRLDKEGLVPEAVALERLRIAQAQRRLGNRDAASRQLHPLRQRLPADRQQDWQLAWAQGWFDRARFADALRTLQPDGSENLDAYRYLDQSDEAVRTANYRRYNLAIALVRTGDKAQGLSLLDIVGRLRSRDSEMLALRDQANLALGWQFLADKQGATAMGIFGRVKSEGRAANRALLGMGWAQLEPGGEEQLRVRVGEADEDPSNPLPAPVRQSLIQLGALEPETMGQAGPSSFTRERPAKTVEERYRRALSFWNYLSERDPRDLAVQEGLLAVALAHDKLGDPVRANAAYTQALAAMEGQKKAIAERQSLVRSGGLTKALDALGGPDQLTTVMESLDLPPGDANVELYTGAERYLDLLRLRQRAHERGGAELLPALETALNDTAQTLTALAQHQLDRQQEGLVRYLKPAYFAAARAEDKRLSQGLLR